MNQDIVSLLKNGQVGILPTDTLYGLVGSALNKDTIERIYKLKRRSPEKPSIILISSLNDLEQFSIHLDSPTKKILEKIWPNPVSVVLPCQDEKLFYLHRGTNALAFRIPNDQELLNLLKQTGPIIAPSANPEGESPSQTIEEAKKYFAQGVDFYLDGGVLNNPPSTLIQIKDHQVHVLRQGSFTITS